MFPEINEASSSTVQSIVLDGIMYKFNFDTETYEILDGNLVPIEDKKERIKQWLKFLIKAEFDNVDIYRALGFGLSLKKYIGKKSIPLGFISSEIKEQLIDKIKLNSLIKEVTKVTVEKSSKDKLIISIWIVTDDSEKLKVASDA